MRLEGRVRGGIGEERGDKVKVRGDEVRRRKRR